MQRRGTVPLRGFEFPASVPELLGDRVRLRELSEDDIPAWFERASDPESAALAGDPVPESVEAGYAWLERNRERFRRREGIRWAVVPRGRSRSVGSVGLALAPAGERVAELGIVIARACWGRGMGTSAVRAVASFAFGSLGLAELRAELLASNVASRRVLEKAGFRFQCVVPDFEPSAMESRDGYRYVFLRDAWAAREPA